MTIDKEVKRIQQKKAYQNIQSNELNLRYDEVIVLDLILTERKQFTHTVLQVSINHSIYISHGCQQIH